MHIKNTKKIVMIAYKELLKKALEEGDYMLPNTDRTGVGRYCLYGERIVFDLSKEFPAITLKKTFLRGAIVEFCWMMNGRTDIKYLQDNGVNFWNEWQNTDGTIGKGYGFQARKIPNLDQLRTLVDGIRKIPYSTRHVFTFWSCTDVKDMVLPSCHGTSVVFNVTSKGALNMHTQQRSQDLFLGAPINYAFYGIFLYYIATLTNKKVGKITYDISNAHIYANHVAQVKECISREPLKNNTILSFSKNKILDAYEKNTEIMPEWFIFENYVSHPHIAAPVAV